MHSTVINLQTIIVFGTYYCAVVEPTMDLQSVSNSRPLNTRPHHLPQRLKTLIVRETWISVNDPQATKLDVLPQ